MTQSELEMLGANYPNETGDQRVWTRAFQIHNEKHDEGHHPGTRSVIAPLKEAGVTYCDCYQQAWIELIAVPKELLHRDPNEALFEPRDI